MAGRRKPAAEVPTHLEHASPADILEQALTLPGELGDTYSRFIDLSINNQVLLLMQHARGPVNTFSRWKDLDRNVMKGEKAKWIRRPIFRKEKDESTGEEKQRLTGFRLVKCMFDVYQTEGEELPPFETSVFSASQALSSLAITQVAFNDLDGNTAGYSINREVAVSPVAKYPRKTLLHEISHVCHGHTTPENLADYQTHRGLREFEAEGSAYLVMNRLGELDQFDASESRAYIQRWLGQDVRPPEESIRRVMKVADTILKAGRVAVAEAEDAA